MRDEKLELREQRDLLTVIRCMLRIIPKHEVELRESLESILPKVSYPGQYNLVEFNKEISLILFDNFERCKFQPWMQYALSIYLDITVDDVLLYLHNSNEITCMKQIQNMCEKGNLKAYLEIFEDEEYAHIKIKDTKSDESVIIRTLSN